MAEQKKPVMVKALRAHTFNGKSYEEGASYAVYGDDSQTAEQYVETLGAVQFASRVEPGQQDEQPKPEAQSEPQPEQPQPAHKPEDDADKVVTPRKAKHAAEKPASRKKGKA